MKKEEEEEKFWQSLPRKHLVHSPELKLSYNRE